MLSTLVTGGLFFTSFIASADNVVEAPHDATGETQIELPSSELEIYRQLDYMPRPSLEEFIQEGESLEAERKAEELRIELEKARKAEEARLVIIEAERKERERLARIEAEKKAKAEAQRQAEIKVKQKQAQTQQSQLTEGVAFNGSYYTPYCNGCSGVTATGEDVRDSVYYNGMRIIATDPRVIPMYSIVEVSTPTETFKAIVLDTGGAIKGHKVDILVANKETAYKLGRHTVYVKVLKNGK